MQGAQSDMSRMQSEISRTTPLSVGDHDVAGGEGENELAEEELSMLAVGKHP